MIFNKGEVLELKNEKKYIVIDSAVIDNETYFKVKTLSNDNNNLIGDYVYIRAHKKEDKIFVDDELKEEVILKLKVLFEN